MNPLRKIYYRLAKRIYSVGRQEYEKQVAQMMFDRAIVGEGTVFNPGGEINNLSAKKENIIIGKHCQISGLLMVYPHGGKITIGDYCSVSPQTRIIAVKNIHIGNRVLIAHNVNILDNVSHPIDAALRHDDFVKSYSSGTPPHELKGQDITIEDDAWIGLNTVILRGVTIGKGAIIGAGSFVTKDVQPWTINVGNPLRCIRELTPVTIN